ncbi:MAG: MIP family channel protein [Planctomycetota bacterium]
MMRDGEPKLIGLMIAEAVGTFLLVFFGIGVVHVEVFAGVFSGQGQIALAWGVGVGLAIYATAAISGAHLNPAVTLAFAVFRGFSWKKVFPYVVSQTAGAFAAAALLYGLFYRWIARFEADQGLARGEPGSQLSARAYGEYFPNPAVAGTDTAAFELLSVWQAFAAEAVGTGLLVLFIFVLIEPKNRSAPGSRAVALPIGLVVSAIICVLAVLTQAGLNPARDFGPRLFAFMAGWGEIAIPGPRGGFFTVYVLGPLVGGVAGAAIHDVLLRRYLPPPPPPDQHG